VQITAGPIKPIIDKLRDETLSFLGVPVVKQKANNNTLIFRFESEIAPVMPIRLKVETNCREHFSVLGWSKFPFSVNSEWYTDSCEITTFHQLGSLKNSFFIQLIFLVKLQANQLKYK